MRIIDLSLPLTHKMPVYPGDPEVDITEVHTLEKEGWNLRRVTLSTHIGTHVNVPYHMVKKGKNLDAYTLDRFMGSAVIYEKGIVFNKQTGIIFRDHNIDQKITDLLIADPPKFIGLSSKFEFDVPLEKLLLKHNIISFENLTNTEKLPGKFMFYGVPLNISGADGSPVRAFAVV
ncbi:MAG: cyclase family protein [Patescibacteria group bacterium]